MVLFFNFYVYWFVYWLRSHVSKPRRIDIVEAMEFHISIKVMEWQCNIFITNYPFLNCWTHLLSFSRNTHILLFSLHNIYHYRAEGVTNKWYDNIMLLFSGSFELQRETEKLHFKASMSFSSIIEIKNVQTVITKMFPALRDYYIDML